jgi:predicted phage-related endonuclease
MSTNEIQTKARELKELKLMQEELAAEISAIEDTLKAAMGEQEELVCGEYKLTYQTVTSSRFDSTRFKKDHAELAAAYTKATSYRRFSVR